MISAVRRIQFCYGHRVLQHEGKCANLHGHNGVVFIHAVAPQGLDKLGRVIDFSILKETIGKWIDENWDHRMILYKEDKQTLDLIEQLNEKNRPYVLELNPTAENLARFLLLDLAPKILYKKDIVIHKVVFWETENCYAEVSVDPAAPKVLESFGILLGNCS